MEAMRGCRAGFAHMALETRTKPRYWDWGNARRWKCLKTRSERRPRGRGVTFRSQRGGKSFSGGTPVACERGDVAGTLAAGGALREAAQDCKMGYFTKIGGNPFSCQICKDLGGRGVMGEKPQGRGEE